LFWARCAERYLRGGGSICFVLPYAVLNAPVFAGLRRGEMGPVRIRLSGAWALEKVWPIFGAQSGASTTSTCVLFGQLAAPPALPATIDRWTGRLPRRDADSAEAARALVHHRVPWPAERTLIGGSPYRERFRQGATIVPRRFFFVEMERGGRLGVRRDAPIVRGRIGTMDKAPWNTVVPLRGPVEVAFLRNVLLGETVAPYRLFEPAMAVIPLDGDVLLDSAAAREADHRLLAQWLRDIEAKWAAHSNRDTAGGGGGGPAARRAFHRLAPRHPHRPRRRWHRRGDRGAGRRAAGELKRPHRPLPPRLLRSRHEHALPASRLAALVGAVRRAAGGAAL
jgi:hypothetical protein